MVEIFDFAHARSSAALNAKTQGSTSLPRASKASRTSKNLSGAILPRSSQLLTAEAPTPTADAAAVVPPKASTTASTVVSMTLHSSQSVKMSRLHRSGVDFTACESPKLGMHESNKSLARRLKLTREALGVIPAEVCKRLRIGANAWSMYESGERRITVPVAIKFCNEYGLTLDWIYRADPSRLPHEVRMKLPPEVA
jgi:hypothetical protein